MAANTEFVNIGPKETRKRLLMGVVMVTAGVVLAIIFSRTGVSRRPKCLITEEHG